MNSDELSDMQIIHWRHHFKRLHDKGTIANNTLNMANNHLRLLHYHHVLWHRSKISQYFDFGNINFIEDRIKGIARSKMKKIKVKMKQVKPEREKFLCREKEET